MKTHLQPQPPVIRHIYNSHGKHCIEANGTRGEFAMYDSVATHPAGYAAVTDYFSGPPKLQEETLFARGLRDVIPEGGMVWKISRVQWVPHSVVPDGGFEGCTSSEMYEKARQFDKAYTDAVPYDPLLQALHDEYIAANPLCDVEMGDLSLAGVKSKLTP